ncbi:Crp/Fnr family transcriptional regulator [Flavobacterium soyangense]|uniref:Crp/Fnr family transcriptional regulator n=1 Tax=Flavobacterium soyangense TaxID=2023265 RepID=A0A930XV30_9FLAO|nr:Crp/Fnr family transcriptional regulator [Flavobacterium soyangense]MBF2707866.1 Crp/Fnr family transcriptional regulator [Flavobacterium soyangense]
MENKYLNKYLNYFSRISTLSEEEIKVLTDRFVYTSFKKGTVLLKEGQQSVDTYFILEGCIREYISTDGDEKTTNFFTEEQWVISLSNFSPQNPTLLNLVCVEDTTVLIGNEQLAQEIFLLCPRFETISRAIVEADFAEQKKALTSFLTDTAEQRYLKLLKLRPDLFQRIPQFQLASYLGIMPESLSRIRKRITLK